MLNALELRLIGPHRGGRVVAVAGDPVNPAVFYFGACAGGVWKTTNGGQYWENVSDGFFNTAAVGAIDVSRSDPNVIYAGTGEATIRGNVTYGDGVYKSTDAGKTWKNVGLSDTRHIGKLRIHPNNPDVVYVAALGHAFGRNPERGVFRTLDGGQTWEKVLFINDQAGAIDLSLDPHNPRIIYATTWRAQRTPYSLEAGGEGSGIYKSTDGGETWTELTRSQGLPRGTVGKIGIAVSPARTDRVYAIIEAEDGAVFRSDDGGETWVRGSDDGKLRWRAWYYHHIIADPQDPDTVWVLDLDAWKSIDGGLTFSKVATPHGDNHDLWIDPNNPQRMIEGNDGGACVTYNGGLSWSSIYNQPTAQLYHATTDSSLLYRVYGSQQDNTAISIPSMSVEGAITQAEWFVPGGGESGYITLKPTDENIIVAGAIGSGEGNGRLTRFDRRTGQGHNITVWPIAPGLGDGAKELRYRFQWTFPALYSPHDPDTLFVTSQHVHRSTDEGTSWDVISPDLTRNDVTRMEASGGPLTKDNTGAEVYGTIFAFQESPHEQGVFWTGSDDGLIHISRDGGANWENITPPDLPEWALISVIELSPHDAGTAYVAATRYKLDDVSPYLYKTIDYGKTWEKITSGIPEHDYTRVIREDPSRRGLLYAGTETGVYVSFDDGANWQRFQSNLPIVPIHDLVVKGTDLVVATHGRSFWILDDLTPLHQMKDEIENQPSHLFQPRNTVRIRVDHGFGSEMDGGTSYQWAGPLVYAYRKEKKPTGETARALLDAGENRPDGVIITYFLKEKPDGEVTLACLDANGNELRRFSSVEPSDEAEDPKSPRLPVEAGTNRFVWNMRLPFATKIPGDSSVDSYLEGPRVVPGRYSVRLSVGGQEIIESFEIVRDPRVEVSQEDLQAQFGLLHQVWSKLSETHEAVKSIRNLRGQIEAWEKRVEGQDSASGISESAKPLKERLTEVENALIQVNVDSPLQPPSRLNTQLAALVDFIDSADAAPTRQQREAFEELSGRINDQLNRLREIIDADLAAFNNKVRESGVPPVGPDK